MKKYLYFSRRSERGSPSFVSGLLHETFAPEKADLPPNYDWYWAEPGTTLGALPSSLVLIVKDPLIDFDIRSGQQASDFYITNDLLAELRKVVEIEGEFASLDIVGKDGVSRAERGYSYIRLANKFRLSGDIVDLQSSKIDLRRSGEIKKIHSLALKSSMSRDLFMINEMSIFRHLFVSDVIASSLSSKAWCGFALKPIEEIGAHDRI